MLKGMCTDDISLCKNTTHLKDCVPGCGNIFLYFQLLGNPKQENCLNAEVVQDNSVFCQLCFK